MERTHAHTRTRDDALSVVRDVFLEAIADTLRERNSVLGVRNADNEGRIGTACGFDRHEYCFCEDDVVVLRSMLASSIDTKNVDLELFEKPNVIRMGFYITKAPIAAKSEECAAVAVAE